MHNQPHIVQLSRCIWRNKSSNYLPCSSLLFSIWRIRGSVSGKQSIKTKIASQFHCKHSSRSRKIEIFPNAFRSIYGAINHKLTISFPPQMLNLSQIKITKYTFKHLIMQTRQWIMRVKWCLYCHGKLSSSQKMIKTYCLLA